MANIGELPDVDMKMPSEGLDMPPMMDLDLPVPGFDSLPPPAILNQPPTPAAQVKKAAPVKKAVQGSKIPTKAAPAKAKAPVKMPSLGAGGPMPLLMNVVCILLLAIIAAVMVLFEVPINEIPELTLTTYVQSLWLLIGCAFVVAILQDLRSALWLTGANLALLAIVFPTLWLVLDTQMNPLYFFVMGMIALQAFVYLPLSLLRPKGTSVKAPMS